MIVGSAEITVTPDATGFGSKTEAAVKAALAGVRAAVSLTLDEKGLRTKIEAAVKTASAGANAKIGTDVDASPIRNKIKKAVQDATADVGDTQLNIFDIDPAKLVAEVEAAKEAARLAAARGIQLPLDLDFNFGDARAKAEAALAASLAGLNLRDIEIPVKANDEHVVAEVEAIREEAERVAKRGRVSIPIVADPQQADAVGAAAGGVFGRAVLRTAVRALAVAGGIQLFPAAVSGLDALAGAAISAASALGTLGAAGAAIPSILGAIAQAAAVTAIALGGIGGALKAFEAQRKAAGVESVGGAGAASGERAAASAARAIRNATQGIADAQRSAADAIESANERVVSSTRAVASAQRDLSDAYETGGRRVEDAERTLSRAQRDQQDAQEALTKARADAAQEVDDLRRSLARLALTEDEAQRRLTEARTKAGLEAKRASQDLTGVTEETLRALERQAALEDKAASNPREKAANDLRDAELDLAEAQQKRTETQTKLTQAEKVGVEGNEKVISAREKLSDANTSVTDSTRDLALAQRDAARSIADGQERVTLAIEEQTKAQRDLVRAHEDGDRRIADSLQALADAQENAALAAESAGGAAAGAADRYQAALNDLSPAARAFVEHLVALRPKLLEIQAIAANGIFPPLTDAIDRLLPLVDRLTPVVDETSRAIGGLIGKATDLVTSPGFSADIVKIAQGNVSIIRSLGDAALYSADSLRHIAVVGEPLAQHLADLARHFSKLVDEALAAGRESGALQSFFDRLQTRIDHLIVTVGFFGKGLATIFTAARPAGDAYLGSLERIAAKFDILTEKALKSGALKDFFEAGRPAIHEVTLLIGDLAAGLLKIGQANLGSLTGFINQLRTELLPVLLEVLGNIDPAFLESLVTLATNLSKLIGTLLTGTPVLTVIVQALAGFADGVNTLLTDVPLLSPILLGLVTTLGALGTVAAAIKIEQFAAKFAGSAAGADLLTGALTRMGISGGVASGAIALLGRAFLALGVGFAIKSVIDGFAPSLDKATDAVIRAKNPVAEFDNQLRKLQTGGSFFEKVATNIKDIMEKGPIAAFSQAGRSIASVNQAFTDLANKSPADAQKVVDSWDAQGKSTLGYKRILDDVIQSKAKQGVAEEDVTKKIALATESLKRNNDALQINADKLKAATDQALGLSNASIATEAAEDRLTAAVKDSSGNFDINTAKGREARSALNDMIGSIQREITELGNSAAAGKFDNDRKQQLIEHLDFLAKSGYPGAREQAERLRGELEAIQPTYFATVNIDTEQAQQAMIDLRHQFNLSEEAAKNAIAAFGAANAVKASSDIASDTGDITKNFPGRAFGGMVERNRAYIVGEKRPELFIPNQSGVILPQVPDFAIPQGLDQATHGLNFMPASSNFDINGLLTTLRDLESTLTDNLSAMDDIAAQRRDRPSDAAPTTTTVEQHFNEPLVRIEATFGPGSSAADIIAAMRAIAKDEISGALAEQLKNFGAGVGTRNTP